jgi:hypothetical protein
MLTNCNSQGYEIELGTTELGLTDTWFSCWDDRYDTYEDLLKDAQVWYKQGQNRYNDW